MKSQDNTLDLINRALDLSEGERNEAENILINLITPEAGVAMRNAIARDVLNELSEWREEQAADIPQHAEAFEHLRAAKDAYNFATANYIESN